MDVFYLIAFKKDNYRCAENHRTSFPRMQVVKVDAGFEIKTSCLSSTVRDAEAAGGVQSNPQLQFSCRTLRGFTPQI